MSNPLLSILIPSTPDRRDDVAFLSKTIYNQLTDVSRETVELKVFEDDKTMSIGEKRELMYKESNGLFSWQIDSDDSISENAIELILAAIQSNPEIDCITFREKCLMNGEYKSSNHSIKYSKWQDGFDGYDYVRSPFYKDVIRTDISRSVPFPKVRWREDELWSIALYPHLKNEIHLEEEIYIYIYEPKDSHEERYGFNKQ